MLLFSSALALLSALSVKLWNGLTPSAAPLVVDLGYAKYQGVPSTRGNTNFLGIRFAAPPTGEFISQIVLIYPDIC